jgi:adenosylcobalamin-dependent ribonucleoside-triphosphate reductase
MEDEPDGADEGAMGPNPCVEQTLWDRELCCLVETYPAHHETFEDYRRTLRLAYEYAKTVTLVAVADPRTNEVMMRNRRLGCSMTGVVQAINRLGARRFFDWCDRGYRYLKELDRQWSERLGMPRSIKLTSVKPSGTVSILAGATPGVHWEHASYYIRRVRLAESHLLVEMCRQAGYPTEPDHYADNSIVVSFPVHVPGLDRPKSQVSLREKVELAARMQRWWSDNQVSCTAEFDPGRERDEIPRILAEYEDRLKAIALLPAEGHGYEQAPYEEITEGRYREMIEKLSPLRGDLPHEQELEDRFCEGGICELR